MILNSGAGGGSHLPLFDVSTHKKRKMVIFFEILNISILLELQLSHTKTITKQICQEELLHFGLV